MNSRQLLFCGVFCIAHTTWATQPSSKHGTCTVYIGYDIRPGFDLELIPYSSGTECCKLCFQHKDCKGWTMFEGKCHLKGTNELVKARDEHGTYSGLLNVEGNEAKFSTDGPQVESPNGSTGLRTKCSLHQDYEIVGGDMVNLGYMYLSECCHQCGNTEGCEGWTYHEWECILKNGTTLAARVGDISGLKISAVAEADVAPSSSN